MIITTTLAIPVVAVTTVATMLFIGLGFLPQPSRATMQWASAFAVAMLAAYVYIAADTANSQPLRALGSGLILGALTLFWTGIRSYNGKRRSYLYLSVAATITFPTLLIAASFGPFYALMFRTAFAIAGVIGAVAIVEMLRMGKALRDDVLPLVAAMGLLVTFTVISMIDGVLVAVGVTAPSDSLLFIRSLNLIGVVVFVTCALVTALLLATRSGRAPHAALQDLFDTVARDRLARAEALEDPWWSLLDIRLDDPDDIRAASSTAAFGVISERFQHIVRTSLPADADLAMMSATRVVALVPRAQGGMREIVVGLLERLSTQNNSDPLPMRLSASIGWAQPAIVGYNLDVLAESAAGAARQAHAAGGDRWERIRAAD